tara:strand:- start:11506 stop:13341 length:1836 start_codon:yes stop_codon:yes gene_type:complete
MTIAVLDARGTKVVILPDEALANALARITALEAAIGGLELNGSVISADATFVCSASGGDFTGPEVAMRYLQKFNISDSATVTLSCPDESYTLLYPIPGHPQGHRINIEGADMAGAVPVIGDFALTGPGRDDRAADRPVDLAMLRSKFSTEFIADELDACIELRGQKIGTLKNVLLTNAGDTAYGIITGAQFYTGSGGNIRLENVSIHGFDNCNICCRYGGSVIGEDSTLSVSHAEDNLRQDFDGNLWAPGIISVSAKNYLQRNNHGGTIYADGGIFRCSGIAGIDSTNSGMCWVHNAVVGQCLYGLRTTYGGQIKFFGGTVNECLFSAVETLGGNIDARGVVCEDDFRKLPFDSGGTTPIATGDSITGFTSGATADVRYCIHSEFLGEPIGTWAGGDAEGYLMLENVVGSFQSGEGIIVGMLNVGTTTAVDTLPTHGVYSNTAGDIDISENAYFEIVPIISGHSYDVRVIGPGGVTAKGDIAGVDAFYAANTETEPDNFGLVRHAVEVRPTKDQVTIASGVVTLPNPCPRIVDLVAESGTSDEVDSFVHTNLPIGETVMFVSSHTITFNESTSLRLGASTRVLDSPFDCLTLLKYNAAAGGIIEQSFADNN